MMKIQTFGKLLEKAGMTFKPAKKIASLKQGSIFNVALKNGGMAEYSVTRHGNQLWQTVKQNGGKKVTMISEQLNDLGKLAYGKNGKSLTIPGRKITSSIMEGGCQYGTHASVQKITPAVDLKIANGKLTQKINYNIETHANDLIGGRGGIIMPTDSLFSSDGLPMRVFQREPKMDVSRLGTRLDELTKIYG